MSKKGVSDVIAVGRVGMLDRIVDVEKADYDGESRYISVFCDCNSFCRE